MGSLVTQLFSQTFDSDGNIAPLARMYWYEAGTSTPVTVYTDAGLSVAHSNPINADASGVFAAVYAPAGTYKIVVKESAAAGGATIYEVDNFEIIETTIAISFPTSVKTANFTVAAADRAKTFLCDASGAPGQNIICTADSATLGNGFPFFVINTAATGTITIQGTGAQTVNGSASRTISGINVGLGLTSVGASGWQVMANSALGTAATKNTGTSAGDVVEVQVGGKLPAVDGSALTDLPIIVSASNLRTASNAANPNSKMDISADQIALKTTGGAIYIANNAALTVDITGTAANGLDTGVEANSTWYHLWVIYNGTTLAGLISTSATSPTMPSGYTYKGYAGVAYNDSGGNFRLMASFGRKVHQADVEALNAAGVTSWTSLSIATSVPPNAISAHGRSSNAANQVLGIRLASNSTGTIGVVEAVVNSSATSVVDSQYGGVNFSLPVITSQTIWRKHNATTAGQIIIINGFELPICA